MTLPQDYKYLVDDNHFTEEEILSKAETLYKQCANFLEKVKQTNKKLYIHEGKLAKLVCDYFAGLARLKSFHGIEWENPVKQAAYTSFRVLRFSPIQIADNSEGVLFPNELLAVSLIFTECQNAIGETLSKSQEKVIRAFGQEASYVFRFRSYNQQSIEFVLDAFVYGLKAGHS